MYAIDLEEIGKVLNRYWSESFHLENKETVYVESYHCQLIEWSRPTYSQNEIAFSHLISPEKKPEQTVDNNNANKFHLKSQIKRVPVQQLSGKVPSHMNLQKET